MTEIYLKLDRENLEKTKEQAKKRDQENLGDESNGYLYEDLHLDDETIESNHDGSFQIYGDLTTSEHKNLGYLDVNFRPDMDLVIELIEFYMKKLGKLKTIMEATK